MLESKIIHLVPEITLNCWDQQATKIRTGDKIFRAIVTGEISQLKKIDHLMNDFREKAGRYPLKPGDIHDQQNLVHMPVLQCCTDILSKAVTRLEEINLRSVTLPTVQVRAILDTIIQSDHLTLKTLVLNGSGNRLSGIPADILVRAAVKLEHTNIHRFLFFPEHINCLFRTIAESAVMDLKSLDTSVYHKDLSSVPPDLVAAALVRVEVVARAENLSYDQANSLFKRIASCDNIKLRRLDMYKRIDLSQILPDVLAEAVVRLREVNISGTALTPLQVMTIFQRIASCDKLQLSSLDISQNNLHSVPSELLYCAVSKLSSIDLGHVRPPTYSTWWLSELLVN